MKKNILSPGIEFPLGKAMVPTDAFTFGNRKANKPLDSHCLELATAVSSFSASVVVPSTAQFSTKTLCRFLN
jgi:hypothetical protein